MLYPKLDHICFIYIENRCDTRRWVTINIQRVNYITILRKKNKVSLANYEPVNWSGRNWKVHTLKSKTTKGKENCQWNENISAIFVVNKQRKHSRSFGLTGCCPWPLIGKVFFIDIGKRMATIMNLIHCRVCSEVYRGSFPKARLLSLSFHHSKGGWWHRSSTAVNINKFSCCNKS